MELWIRSQDKESLVKVDNLYISIGNYICYYVEKGKELPNTYYRPASVLGRYKSKKRALEVLDEIQNIIIGKYAISLDMEAALSKNISKKEAEQMLMQMAVYEMPKE